MKAPQLSATIERRLLVNYRVDPEVAQTLLPDGLRPQLVDGSAVAGVCLIRLGSVRPSWIRPRIGWGAENAAHRVAVEWDDATGIRTGVFIPHRHTASRLPVIAGGRLYPGVYEHARFASTETADRITVRMDAPASSVRAEIAVVPEWRSSLFATLDDASEFFREGHLGWSPDRNGNLEALELETNAWQVEPGSAVSVESSFFAAMPAGGAELDCVLVMRDVPVTWNVPTIAAPGRGVVGQSLG